MKKTIREILYGDTIYDEMERIMIKDIELYFGRDATIREKNMQKRAIKFKESKIHMKIQYLK